MCVGPRRIGHSLASGNAIVGLGALVRLHSGAKNVPHGNSTGPGECSARKSKASTRGPLHMTQTSGCWGGEGRGAQKIALHVSEAHAGRSWWGARSVLLHRESLSLPPIHRGSLPRAAVHLISTGLRRQANEGVRVLTQGPHHSPACLGAC